MLVRRRSPPQNYMHAISRRIFQDSTISKHSGDVFDVIKGYHGSDLRDASCVVKLEVIDDVLAVLGAGCSTALARLIVATIYPNATEIEYASLRFNDGRSTSCVERVSSNRGLIGRYIKY